MNNFPLVSVIIPCYNAEKYVEQAVRSMMEQTYADLEILCCDDCSTDGTFAILQKLAAEDSRVKLFKNETNQKIVKTLNSLVAAANGKYIARMDADDISLPKRIEKQVAFLEGNPDYALCGTNAWHIDGSGRRIGKSYLSISNCEIKRTKFIRCPFYHPAVCIRSDILKQNKYDYFFDKVEDYDLWLRIIEKNNTFNLKERLLKYRKTSSGISYNYSDEIRRKLIALFSKYLNISAQDAAEYVLAFYTRPEKTSSDKVKKIVYDRFKKSNLFLNAACLKKEYCFARKNRQLAKYIIFHPFIFLMFIFKSLCLFIGN